MADLGDVVSFVDRTPAREAAWQASVDAIRGKIAAVVPGAIDVNVVHVGATATAGVVTKGDVDVAVVVGADDFAAVVAAFDGVFVRNVGGYASDNAVSFDDVSTAVGVHVCVRGGADEEQWVYGRLLGQDPKLVAALNAVKAPHDGHNTDGYRAAKGAFFATLRQSPSFAAAKAMPSSPVLCPIVVQWGDMDAYQHVNNVVYLRWFETARMALFQRLGFTSGTGVGPILHSTSCRYRVPVYAPDDVVAAVRVTDVKADRFALEMSVYSARAGAVAATGDAVIVAYDYEAKRKAAVPAEVLERLRDVVAEGALIPPLAPQR